jgi:biopolymer transport protein ExbB
MRRLLISTALLSASATSALAEPSALEKAYAKELAYLKAEKAALEARLAATDLSTLKAEKQLKSELGAAEDRLLLARRRAEEIEGRLRGLERQSDGEERSSFVRESVARAEETLGGYGVSASSDPEALLPDAVRSVFVSASRAIEEGAQLRRGPGTFFLADGRQVEGQLVHWGRVAAFGDSPEGAGILVPAGGGRLRVWDEPAAAVAVALARGSAPAVLRTFLFEATDVAVKKREAKTVAKELALGGSIAYVIAALGLLALLMVMLRSVRLLAEGARVGTLGDEPGARARGRRRRHHGPRAPSHARRPRWSPGPTR